MFVASSRPKLEFHSFSSFLPCNTILNHACKALSCLKKNDSLNQFSCFASLEKSNSEPDPNGSHNLNTTPKKAGARLQKSSTPSVEVNGSQRIFPSTIPKKPRRGRKSEASAVEDLLRDTLERTFASIREQNPGILKDKKDFIKERVDEASDLKHSSDVEDDDDGGGTIKNKMVVEEDSPDWPPDADIGWGIRASEYFDQHPIKNIVGEDGVEIDWEGEIDDNWVKEINCLEWERFAFHPSPLIVLVFERYNRASENWKVLEELEKAVQVYLGAKHLLPPRTVKIDINIERDLAYALKVKDCPQILFLRGHKILYREKEIRTADELVQTIAYFYFKAKKPPHINEETISRPF